MYRFALASLLVVVSVAFFITVPKPQIPKVFVESIGIVSERVFQIEQPEVVDSGILFTGDVLLARGVEWAMNDHGPQYPYVGLVELFAQYDSVVVNFEGSVPSKHVPTKSMELKFSVNAEHLLALASSGVTHANLANNHSYDFGREGYDNTRVALQKSEVQAFAHPYVDLDENSITYIETDNKRVAVIGIDLTLSSYSESVLQKVFDDASRTSDMQIVVVHWGTEYVEYHSPEQESFAKLFIALGADLVIGHHPHVVQDIGLIEDVPVIYSLGNTIFDQYFDDDVQQGLLVGLRLESKPYLELHPVTSIGSRNQPRQMSLLERSAILEDLSQKSHPDLRESILGGVIQF